MYTPAAINLRVKSEIICINSGNDGKNTFYNPQKEIILMKKILNTSLF